MTWPNPCRRRASRRRRSSGDAPSKAGGHGPALLGRRDRRLRAAGRTPGRLHDGTEQPRDVGQLVLSGAPDGNQRGPFAWPLIRRAKVFALCPQEESPPPCVRSRHEGARLGYGLHHRLHGEILRRICLDAARSSVRPSGRGGLDHSGKSPPRNGHFHQGPLALRPLARRLIARSADRVSDTHGVRDTVGSLNTVRTWGCAGRWR
jgi:hypothetical protein